MKAIIKIISVILSFVFVSGVFAQGSGKLVGKVTDAQTGEAIIGANILIEGTSIGGATDFNGDYIILKIPSGKFSIKASYIGYSNTIIKNVQILTDLTTNLDITISESSVNLGEEVVVIAQAQLVKKDLTSTESRVTSEEIDKLPLQDVNQLISLQAGVNRDQNGGIHIRGGRSSEVSYLVNGISITDDFSRSQAFSVETGSIQELQVISGTFNAEYGNAMSGVVNIITKAGSSEFKADFEAWTGDYFSGNNSLFWNIDSFNPAANYNFQGSIGGPLFYNNIRYFAAVRRYNNSGYIYGINANNPAGRSKFENGEIVPNPGDSSFVSMNNNDRWSGQATIEIGISEAFKLKIDAFGSSEFSKSYNHLYRLNPNGYPGTKTIGYSVFTNLTHVISNSTFQELTFAYKFNENSYKLYDIAYDSRYVHPDSLNVPGYHFYTAGTELNRFNRNTRSLIAKWNLVSQLDQINLAKIGVEVQFDNLFYEDIDLIPATNSLGQQIYPFKPFIQGIETTQHDRFERKPYKYSAYIQDKIEFESLIINVGLRFDVFNPNGKVPNDPSDPNIYNPFKLENIYHDTNKDGKIGLDEQVDGNQLSLAEKEAYWYKNTSIKKQLSPRFGIAYPITDKGIIRFSYGIFQQIPEYSQLYQNDQFKLTTDQGIQGPFGNNDLKPQRTTIYEIGLQQQFFDNLALDVTAFYRDIRDWISSSQAIPTFLAGIAYSQRINRDFANVKGVTLSINKRFADMYSFGIDYTFQIAEGTNSSADEEFFAQQNGSEPKRLLTPLDWDQTHTLNSSIYVGDIDWGVSLISTIHTGQPYTPTIIEGAISGRNVLTGLTSNSRRKPLIANFDLELHKDFDLSSFYLQIFVKVFNLLDAQNPLIVFGDTGKPDYTLDEKQVRGYDENWFVYPNYYSEPRSIYVGTKISL
ncbi:MAG: TonB-dependent receptor [Bacteroidetes bacterium]|nr:TonB-dependent receptor [Bacteroidota bacterium]MBU1116524.1 TonB-dependent receptor [Bacteroidota bacterium]MBU1798406.1 TonB-dependent receptor [Bacteroidota bacterium]